MQSQCQGWVAKKEKREKKGRVGGEEKKLLTKKRKRVGVGGGDDGVRGRFTGDVYYYTAQPQGGEGRGVGRERQNIPFSLPLQCLYRSHTGGGELCLTAGSRGGGRGSCFCTVMLSLVNIEKTTYRTEYSRTSLRFKQTSDRG